MRRGLDPITLGGLGTMLILAIAMWLISNVSNGYEVKIRDLQWQLRVETDEPGLFRPKPLASLASNMVFPIGGGIMYNPDFELEKVRIMSGPSDLTLFLQPPSSSAMTQSENLKLYRNKPSGTLIWANPNDLEKLPDQPSDTR